MKEKRKDKKGGPKKKYEKMLFSGGVMYGREGLMWCRLEDGDVVWLMLGGNYMV